MKTPNLSTYQNQTSFGSRFTRVQPANIKKYLAENPKTIKTFEEFKDFLATDGRNNKISFSRDHFSSTEFATGKIEAKKMNIGTPNGFKMRILNDKNKKIGEVPVSDNESLIEQLTKRYRAVLAESDLKTRINDLFNK